MITPVIRRTTIAMTLAVALPIVVLDAATPQSALEELIAADRAVSAASAGTDLVTGLTAMFAEDVVIPNPPGHFAEGKAAVVTMLRANPDNVRSQTEWTPVRGGLSADGAHGFTVGFMSLHRPDGATLALKYLAYWVKQAEGWRVVAYKRTRAGEGSPSRAMMAPVLPAQLVTSSTDAVEIARHRDSLDRAERSFSDEAQKIGLGPAFARFGSADRDDSPEYAGGGSADELPVLHDLAASEPRGAVAIRGGVEVGVKGQSKRSELKVGVKAPTFGKIRVIGGVIQGSVRGRRRLARLTYTPAVAGR
jgi:ketosteroid isomerase-like protein